MFLRYCFAIWIASALNLNLRCWKPGAHIQATFQRMSWSMICVHSACGMPYPAPSTAYLENPAGHHRLHPGASQRCHLHSQTPISPWRESGSARGHIGEFAASAGSQEPPALGMVLPALLPASGRSRVSFRFHGGRHGDQFRSASGQDGSNL